MNQAQSSFMNGSALGAYASACSIFVLVVAFVIRGAWPIRRQPSVMSGGALRVLFLACRYVYLGRMLQLADLFCVGCRFCYSWRMANQAIAQCHEWRSSASPVFSLQLCLLGAHASACRSFLCWFLDSVLNSSFFISDTKIQRYKDTKI